jgi:hypothetical protein
VPDVLWDHVDRLVDRSGSLDSLRTHRLQLLAARRWRALGRPVPAEVDVEEFSSLIRVQVFRQLLDTLRDAYDGPIMVMKGLEIAAHYPSPALRIQNDLDVLVDDAESAYAAAVAAGLMPVGPEERYYSGLHHVRPLVLPEHPTVMLEIHRRPNWVPWALAPSALELLGSAVPSRLGLPGLLAPAPEHHAVLVATHAWGDVPLRRVSDMVDVLALLDGGDPGKADAIAAAWRVDRMWRTTVRAARAVILDEPPPWWLRRIAPEAVELRDRTVLENHLKTWLGIPLALPPRRAVAEFRHTLASEVLLQDGERWGERAQRVTQGLRHLNRPNAEHQRRFGQRRVP